MNKNPSLTQNRIPFVDMTKGMAVILVVLGHYRPDSAPEWYHLFVDFIYTFHMPVFMALAGFLFYQGFNKNKSYPRFVYSKFQRLMIPYFSVSFLVITIKLIAQCFVRIDNPISGMAYLKSFYYPEAGFFLWFMYTLFVLFLFVPLCLKYLPKYGLEILGILALFLFLVNGESIPNIFCFRQIKNMLIFFITGCYLSKYSSKLPDSLFVGLFLFFLSMICFYINQSINQSIVCEKLLLLFLGISGCIWLPQLAKTIARCNPRAAGFFSYIGLMSSSIYLFHTTTMSPFKYFWWSFIGVSTNFYFIGSVLLVSTAGVVFPVFIKILINKNKIVSRCLLGEK